MSLALLFHYLLLNVLRMLIHPSSAACDLFDELFHGFYCSGSMWWSDIRMQASACIRISQAAEDGCTNIRNMLRSK